MAIQPHQERMLEEQDELQERMRKLLRFSESSAHDKLPKVEQALLACQYSAMKNYSTVLDYRIELFEDAEDEDDEGDDE